MVVGGPPRPAVTLAEEPRLAAALASFHAQGKAKGETNLWNVISAQTNVAVKTLRQQHAAAKMNPGDILLANLLAASSGKTVAQVIALWTKAGTWTQLAKELRVEPSVLTARVVAADGSLKKLKARTS